MSEQFYNFVRRNTTKAPKQQEPQAITWQEAVEQNKDFEPGEPDPYTYPGA